MVVRIAPAAKPAKPAIAAMLRSCSHELAEFADAEAVRQESGPDAYFDAYWTEDQRQPFLILADEEVAGFCLVRRLETGRHAVAEFYVVPGFRRAGVGRAAAEAVFRSFPGPWQVAELEANLPAQIFWRRVIGSVTGGAYVEGWSEAAPRGPAQLFFIPG